MRFNFRDIARGVRVLAIAGFALAAGSASAMEIVHSEKATITGAKTDMVLVGGQDINISVNSTDDVFAAGKEIKVDQTTADHVFVAGKQITVTGGDIHDFMGAGNHLSFANGALKDDIIAFGEVVSLDRTFTVHGSAVLMGKSVVISAPIGGDIWAAGQEVNIDSVVGGNVRAEGKTLVIGPNARIAGDLSYRAGSLSISPQAVITGKRIVLPAHERHKGMHHEKTLAGMIGSAVFGALALAILSIGMIALFPGLFQRSGAMLTRNPLMAILVGVLGVIVLPIAAFVALITIVGWSLGVALALLWCLTLMLGGVGASAGIGLLLRGLTGGKSDAKMGAVMGWSVLGAVILSAIGLIPVAGGWIVCLLCVIGMGAVMVQGRSALAANA